MALASSIDVSCRHICQKYIAFGRIPVPSKHRVDTSLKLDAVGFVDIVCVNPEILQAIASSLFSAEPNLLVFNLVLPSAIYHVSVCDLFCIRPLCVRKDSIFGNLAANEVLSQAELAIAVVL